MKRILSLFLALFMVTALVPFSTLAENEIWDGSIATEFASGTGTEADPYIIMNGAQLAYLAQTVNAGTTYGNQYFKLGADIYLNNETFEFNPDTGLVKMTDGTNLVYLGTGFDGDESGNNTVFDVTINNSGVMYPDDTSSTTGSYYGFVEQWTPIGNESNRFNGVFDGAGYSVNALYIKDSSIDYQGLFGNIGSTAVIKNLNVKDSYIKGGDCVGGIVGYSYEAQINNCAFEGTAFGYDIGGIAGFSNGTVVNCKNHGVITSYSASYIHVGGIVGCTGGNAGDLSGIICCTNEGRIAGYASKVSRAHIGGIIGGNFYGIISGCVNNGIVNGYGDADAIGGIAGTGGDYLECSISYCYNTAPISGDNSDVGGITGLLKRGGISHCYNIATIKGAEFVGGIAGGGGADDITRCYNMGDVISSGNYAGGIVGSGGYGNTVSGCYNIGDITGTEYVGGLVGHGGYDSYYKSGCTLTDCYNLGTVSGDCYVGGVVGYPAQTLSGTYYLSGCAVDSASVAQNGVGCDTAGKTLEDSLIRSKPLTDEEMKNAESFSLFDFDTVWTMSGNSEYAYPELIDFEHLDYVFGDSSDGEGSDDESTEVPEVNAEIVTESDGTLAYYVDGVKQYGLGLIYLDGYYYHVNNSGVVAVGEYWVSNDNGYGYTGIQQFGEDGKMVVKDGIVTEDDGTLAYYIKNVKQYDKGLIRLESGYYYVNSSGVVVTGDYWITKNNGYGYYGCYTFDETGRLIIKNGIYEESDETLAYYHYNVKQSDLGLIYFEGYYYYVNSNAQVMTGEYWVTKDNYYPYYGLQNFDENGRLIIE